MRVAIKAEKITSFQRSPGLLDIPGIVPVFQPDSPIIQVDPIMGYIPWRCGDGIATCKPDRATIVARFSMAQVVR